MRQRDPDERAALEAMHDGDPDTYLAFKDRQRALRVHPGEPDALAGLLGEWVARTEHGLDGAVMIARDNATRARLNEAARAVLKQDGTLTEGVTIAGREFCVGERVIARRNDRHRDIDNGTRATVTAINPLTGALSVQADSQDRRVLDAAYVAEHVGHAYALTGHGAQGATVEWAAAIGRPSEFTAEWAYTALSRARTQTRLHVIAESAAARRERQHYAPPEPTPTPEQALDATRQAMNRPEAEALALDHADPQELPTTTSRARVRLPLTELAEAGADGAHHTSPPPRQPDWRSLRWASRSIARGPSIHR